MESVLLRASEVEESARAALAAGPYRRLRELRVQATGQGIVVDGTVASYYHKQLAQELLRELALSMGTRVVNRVEVDGEFPSD
jgi:hypothetical protein